MIIDQEDYLEHFGVRGMKWGVRRERRQVALERAAVKGGPKISKVRALGRLGPVDLIRGRGVTGGAARKAIRVGGQLERWREGRSTAMDIIKRYGLMRPTDLVPVLNKNLGKKSTTKSDWANVVGSGVVITNQVLNAVGRRVLAKRAAEML